jgi:hypothetical protein
MVAQFGELHLRSSPNRTSRYIVTAREALEELGVENPSDHILLAAHTPPGTGALSTIVVKRTPFTQAEVDAFDASIARLPDHVGFWAPGRDYGDTLLSQLAGGSADGVDALVASHPRDISAISDDGPFFWHFSPFTDVLADIFEPLDVRDPEDTIGERVLLLLLALSVLYAAAFLLLPFVVVRKQWSNLPAKGISAVYFAALGLGFMFFEITMIQRLVQFLGYPTYSLTVTLASILVSTGLGALLSRRFADRSRTVMPLLLVALAALTVFYRLGLDDLTDALLSSSLGVRVLVAVLVLTPLGLCLGVFMPFGLALVSGLTHDGEQYVAWSWAVNGFFSVIGSVLTTILSMSWGFNAVQLLAFGVYVVAALAFARLHRVAARRVVTLDDMGDEESSIAARPPATAPV